MTLPLKIAVLANLDDEVLRSIPTAIDVEVSVAHDFESIMKLKDVTALVLVKPFNVALVNELWDQIFSGVKWVHSFNVGVDFIAPLIHDRLLENDDITLTNGRGAFSSSLAEYIMTAALYFNKQICRLQRNQEEHKWEKFTMSVLRGKTMGFLGYGDIAKNAAIIAKTAFGMNIAVLRRNSSKFQSDDLASIVDHVVDNSNALFAMCDFVVCTLPGTKETKNFCSSQFELMKPGSVFISCGRGIAVDESALLTALTRHDGICAALDVFETEPLPPTSPLWSVSRDRLLISSHNADLTSDYGDLGWQTFMQNLRCALENRPFATVVDKASGY